MLRIIVLVTLVFTLCGAGYSQQLFTISNQCLAQMKNAERLNNEKKYDSALALQKSIGKCNSKDAKKQNAFGAARAYNGLKDYDQAVVLKLVSLPTIP